MFDAKVEKEIKSSIRNFLDRMYINQVETRYENFIACNRLKRGIESQIIFQKYILMNDYIISKIMIEYNLLLDEVKNSIEYKKYIIEKNL